MAIRRSKLDYTGQERREVLQPLSGDGYSNDDFDKVYQGKTKNPFHNSERDRSKRKRYVVVP